MEPGYASAMSYAVGIDLGTTFTAAAIVDGGVPRMVGLAHDRVSIPSVIAPIEGRSLVGPEAAVVSATAPWDVAREFKRRFGDTTPMFIAGRPHQPDQLTGELLRWVVDHVEQLEGGAATDIVVTHPATWGPYKQDLLRAAATEQSLPDIHLLTEPAAAAIHYNARHRVTDGSTITVYDMGGGTFDVSLLERVGQQYQLRAAGGLERAGGLDLDDAVFSLVIDAIGSYFDELDPDDVDAQRAVARLREECTRAKIGLSYDTRAIVPVVLPGLVTEVLVQRAEFERLISPLIDDTIEATEQAIAQANLTTEPAGVLLVGGSSRVPMITERLTQALGVEVVVDTHPKHAVALGAAASLLASSAAATPPPAAATFDLRETQEIPGATVRIDPAAIAAELSRRFAIVLSGPIAGRVINLAPGTTVFGRDEADGVRGLGNRLVSRQHLALHRNGADVTVADLDSTNGSRIDGVALGPDPQSIEPGAIIDIAGTLVMFDGPGAHLEPVQSVVDSWSLPALRHASLSRRFRRRSDAADWLEEMERRRPLLDETAHRLRRARRFQRPSAAILLAWRDHLPERLAGISVHPGAVTIGWAHLSSLLDLEPPSTITGRTREQALAIVEHASVDTYVPLVIPLLGHTTVIQHQGPEAEAMVRSAEADLQLTSPNLMIDAKPNDRGAAIDLRISVPSSPETWGTDAADVLSGRLLIDPDPESATGASTVISMNGDGAELQTAEGSMPFVPATLQD